MPEHDAWTFGRGRENGVDVTRVPHCIPRRPTALRRILHHFSFGLTSLFPSLWRAMSRRPEPVVTIAPALVAAPVGRLAARLSWAHSWLHMRDFEVEATLATGLMKTGLAARLAGRFERQLRMSFHAVSSIPPCMCRRLIEKGSMPLGWWSSATGPMSMPWCRSTTPRPIARSGTSRPPHVALYSGNIANKQGPETVIEVARRLETRRDLTFVICGEGPNGDELQRRAAGMRNIRFFELQPRERLGELLSLATVHELPQIARRPTSCCPPS